MMSHRKVIQCILERVNYLPSKTSVSHILAGGKIGLEYEILLTACPQPKITKEFIKLVEDHVIAYAGEF